jgi:hypothetical protein
MTSDAKEPTIHLLVRGEVDRFAAISPRMLSLRGQAGDKLQGSVIIVPEDKYAFKLLSAQAREGNLKVGLNERKEGGKTAYTLMVENLRSEAGSFNDTVVLKTDNPLKPELDVRVFVYLRAAPPVEKKAQ